MNIGLFGGTFDPVHRGHLALARAAMEQYKLHRIYFVAANNPPHKQRAAARAICPPLRHAGPWPPPRRRRLCPRCSRLPRMALRRRERIVQEKPNYTIDTVRRMKQSFKAVDKLFPAGRDGCVRGYRQVASGGSAVSRVRVCRGEPSWILPGRCGERAAGEPAPAARSDAALSQAGRHRRFGSAGERPSTCWEICSSQHRRLRSGKRRQRGSRWGALWIRQSRSTSGRWDCIDQMVRGIL